MSRPVPTDISMLIRRAWKFHSQINAISFAARLSKPHRIVMGDHDCKQGGYWVVTPANASRLERVGFEILR